MGRARLWRIWKNKWPPSPSLLGYGAGSKGPHSAAGTVLRDIISRDAAVCQCLCVVFTRNSEHRTSVLLSRESSFVFPGRATKSYDEIIIVIINPFHQKS